MISVDFINIVFTVSALLAQFFILFIIVYVFFFWKKYPAVRYFLARYGMIFSFATAFLATLGSLFYSEVAGFFPCVLCWYQRIFLYPQAIIIGLAIFKKDKRVVDYCIFLSIIGGLIAAYHYLLQFGIFKGSCAVIGYSDSCEKIFFMKLGYITLPFMSLIVFSLISIFLLFRDQNSFKKT